MARGSAGPWTLPSFVFHPRNRASLTIGIGGTACAPFVPRAFIDHAPRRGTRGRPARFSPSDCGNARFIPAPRGSSTARFDGESYARIYNRTVHGADPAARGTSSLPTTEVAHKVCWSIQQVHPPARAGPHSGTCHPLARDLNPIELCIRRSSRPSFAPLAVGTP